MIYYTHKPIVHVKSRLYTCPLLQEIEIKKIISIKTMYIHIPRILYSQLLDYFTLKLITMIARIIIFIMYLVFKYPFKMYHVQNVCHIMLNVS